MKKAIVSLLPLFVVGVLACCGTPHETPKLIAADGTTYYACRNLVWVSSSSGLLGGETVYEIKFTDADGGGHDIRGIKHLEMSDIPGMVPYVLPYPLPDPKADKDRDGKPYAEGRVYTFADGAQATIHNGEWKPLRHKSVVCEPTR